MHIDGGWVVESVSLRIQLYAQLFSVSPQKFIKLSTCLEGASHCVDAKALQLIPR